MGLLCALFETFWKIFQEALAMHDRHDQNSLGLDPIYQTIAVNEPLPYVFASDLGNNTTSRWELADVS
jgi:hypothetical protein